ncbi:angiopoietin-related protein 2-like [Ruditapes philippinarum]|uniref:angiopoietin-related protein 2-like n=1 Tax=Ruditapes philippinarum TaxID=129788 RepID=UPI00295A9B79|nr:angiopoietin-related protein 2-like [Ruditapes philippinarum]
MEIGGIIMIVLAIVSDIYAIDLLKADGRIIYNDCHDALQHGNNKSDFYMVRFYTSEPFEVYCRFGVNGPGIPIMTQKFGSVNFARGWHDYEYGFGIQSSGDFWLGLSRIKMLTDTGYQILTLTLKDWTRDIRTIRYNYFALGPASLRYPLHIGKYVTSHVLPDDFAFSNGMPFATIDRPDANKCAYHQKGGWWYNYCSQTLPTGHYYHYGPYIPAGFFYDGIYYKDWKGFAYSLKYISLELYHI